MNYEAKSICRQTAWQFLIGENPQFIFENLFKIQIAMEVQLIQIHNNHWSFIVNKDCKGVYDGHENNVNHRQMVVLTFWPEGVVQSK